MEKIQQLKNIYILFIEVFLTMYNEMKTLKQQTHIAATNPVEALVFI